MLAEIITIGDEILIGQITNTNASWIARELNMFGIRVSRMVSVGDAKNEIIDALTEASKRAGIIIITGGLGPTSDDITKPVLCEYFDSKLIFVKEVYEHVEKFIIARGSKMNDFNKGQAYVPEKCKVLFNHIGTAPGMEFKKDGCLYFSLPGVPFEMEALMKEKVILSIISEFKLKEITHKTIITQGLGESMLAETIAPWEKQLPSNVKLAYLPSPGIVKLRLSCYHEDNAIKVLDNEANKLNNFIGDYILSFQDETPEQILGRLLNAKNKTISTAESCTGGKISQLITSVSGSSNYFKGAVVAYSNEIKRDVLGVDENLLISYGAVSQQVVESMAAGALSKFKTDYAIAISGIAGPSGGTPDKPVGTVWLALASAEKVVSHKFQFAENRERNILRSAVIALGMMIKFIR